MTVGVARLDEIERRDAWIPIRDHFGIGAFGVNAWKPRDDGTIIPPHDEAPTGHEELYFVVEGSATFAVDGEEVAAPAGTLVFVRDPKSRRGATGDATILSVGGAPGQPYEVREWELGWRWNRDSMRLFEAGQYAEAAAVLREGVAENPDHSGLHYNLACFAALAGETDDVFPALRRAVELHPPFRDLARGDEDFEPVRDDPRFEEALT